MNDTAAALHNMVKHSIQNYLHFKVNTTEG